MPKHRTPRGIARWAFVPGGKAFARGCPRCGAAPYNLCLRVRNSSVTGNGDDGAYLVKLKTFHPERKQPPIDEPGVDVGGDP